MKKKKKTTPSFLFLFVLLSAVVITSNISINVENSVYQIVHAHSFPPNNYARAMAFMDQFQTESNLVKENLINNDTIMAQKHANEANSIFYWELLVEITRQDKQIGDELKLAIEDLRNITSSLSNTTSMLSMEKQQVIQRTDQIIENINTNIEKIIDNTEVLQQSENSDFLSTVTGFFSNLIGGGGEGENNSNDGSIHPIRFAELLDNVLRNYGDAYGVKFDMTDMTNMAMNDNGNSSMMDHSSMNMSDGHALHEEKTDSIINLVNYQSSLGYANKLLEIFNNELKPILASKGEPSTLSTNLENAIISLINSIEHRDTPIEVMTIAHAQIHPNLAEAFDLQILSTS
ncbi:hypothetical protein [Candidatus Nitrosocosmicus franklandus]|uniref:DUF5667 domain-containing protein n=1 Tax=Candidatus Nitrosocosmicus franklandianus TaxID=1798806 RepID=A0A484I959_9ARCH|nr:hypothetical protein [Candidatus Nitrosocosmicus franklandus]VFJ14301.1 conserved exported protein of unknown function [Candidatus Nitrosocosmicus franklandus]